MCRNKVHSVCNNKMNIPLSLTCNIISCVIILEEHYFTLDNKTNKAFAFLMVIFDSK